MKLELGGGTRARGEGFVNLDLCPTADIVHDLDTGVLPLEDQTVQEVYSSHCLEHLKHPFSALHEIARVCVVGARVEIRVPHPLSDMAMTPGHLHVIAPTAIENCINHFRSDWWPIDRHPRRLILVRTDYSPSCYFAHLRRLYPLWTDDDVLKYAPRACHDVRYHFLVVENTP